MLIAGKTAAQTYQLLEPDRAPYLDRARQVSRLTLPHLMPDDGYSGATLPTPYQSVGARGVTSLASKYLLALFPPSQSFVRMTPEPGVMEQLGDGKVAAEVESGLAAQERTLMADIEGSALRPHFYEALLQLVVCGNACYYDRPDGGAKIYRLDAFVVKRDQSGNVLVGIIREKVSKTVLPDEVRATLQEADKMRGGDKPDFTKDEVDIYTAIVRKDPDTYDVFQEVENIVIEGSKSVYKADHLPWIFMRPETDSAQSYGYGHAANQLGDLASLEGLMKALVEASAASARLVFLVNPTSSTRIDQLNRCPNGGFVAGRPDDVIALKVDKGADMSVAYSMIERLHKSLGFAFLLSQSVQRAGERVTAEEIRFLAQELDDVQAGTYSLLAQEFQLPLIRVRLKRLRKEGVIEDLDGIASPTIVTGLEALGRGHDLNKLDSFVLGAQQSVGPDAISKYLNVGVYLKRRATALSLEDNGLVRSEEEVQAAAEQAAQQDMTGRLGPEVIRQASAATQQTGE